jgi:putative endonuclease
MSAPKARSPAQRSESSSGEVCRAEAAQPRRRTSDTVRVSYLTSSRTSRHATAVSEVRAAAKSDLLQPRNSCQSDSIRRSQDLRTSNRQSSKRQHFSPARAMRSRSGMRGTGKRFVYILRSDADPTKHYIGIASNPDERLDWHNAGPSGYTVQHRPWSIVVSLEFPDERAAAHFEKYLKSGSGRAFTKRHFADAADGRSNP